MNNNINIINNNKDIIYQYNSNKDNLPKDQKGIALVSIRYELFDHLIYPLSIKFDENMIIQLFRKLHIMSSIDYKISLNEWIDESLKSLAGFTETEAQIMFNTYKVFSADFEIVNQTNNRYEAQNTNKNTVDVRYLGLFFALQLFYHKAKLSIDARDKTPWSSESVKNQYNSPLSSSPRNNKSLLRSINALAAEQQSILNFIKSNIKLFLRLIASDIHNTETCLNSNEFNTLKFLFKINEKRISNLSNLAPFFVNFSTTTKINIEVIAEWLNNSLSNNSNDYDDLVVIKNISKSVTIKDGFSLSDKNLRLSQCEDSHIYINTNLNSIKISNCINCTILIGAVAKIASIEKCENCNICIATNLIRVSNCIESSLFIYSIYEPIFYGDNRGVSIGPHNANFGDLSIHLKNARISIGSNFMNNFANFINFYKEKQNDIITILPDSFELMVVPFDNKPIGNHILVPKEYIELLKEREVIFMKMKNIIKEANLTEDQEKALHVAIQGFYREWLVSSGNIKNMIDIVKMIDVNYNTKDQNFNDI